MKNLTFFVLCLLLSSNIFAYDEAYEPAVEYESEEYIPAEGNEGYPAQEVPPPELREQDFENYEAEENFEAFDSYGEPPVDTYPADAYEDSEAGSGREADYY